MTRPVLLVEDDQRIVAAKFQHHAAVTCFAGNVFTNCHGDQVTFFIRESVVFETPHRDCN